MIATTFDIAVPFEGWSLRAGVSHGLLRKSAKKINNATGPPGLRVPPLVRGRP